MKEYTPEGKIVNVLKTDLDEVGGRKGENWPFTAIRLDNGNTLISLTHGNHYGEEYWSFVNGQHTTMGGTHLAAFREAQPSAIFVIFITAVWPIIINTAVGVRNVPADYRNVARVIRLSPLDWFLRIVVPAAALGAHAFTAGADPADAPREDALEDYWRTYYASIFNPARMKIGAMLKEMPKRYWKNMPETALIPGLVAGAQARERSMVELSRTQVGGNSQAAWDALRGKRAAASTN